MVEEAQQAFFALAESQGKQILLHGDLHHDNILYDESRGWLAIDPKGIVGEAEYEAGCWLRNPIESLATLTSPNVINERISIIEDKLGLDRERVIGWAFAQSVLAGIWSAEDGESPDCFIEAALALKNCKME